MRANENRLAVLYCAVEMFFLDMTSDQHYVHVETIIFEIILMTEIAFDAE